MKLDGKKVAILATDGFEQSELVEPKKALEDAGATVHVVSPKSGEIKGWQQGNWGDSVSVDCTLDNAKESDYHALVIPGGQMNPDSLRGNADAVSFVRDFFAAHKPVGAICHGPAVLIEAEVVDGRQLTSFHTIKKDLMNAGAKWEDSEVVCDEALVTSRTPDDLPAFNKKLIEEIEEGKHEGQTL